MTDDLKRAMEALEDVVGRAVEGDSVRPRGFVLMYGRTILATLREREQAIEQARKDEREAWERVLPQIRIDSGDVEVVDDDQGPFLSPQFIAKAMAAAIRARGAR